MDDRPVRPDVREARREFPATAGRAYFNTAAVGLASRTLDEAYRAYLDDWTASGPDWPRGEEAAQRARRRAASIMGADPSDVALIGSVSGAAGLVAAQFGPAAPGLNVVIGEREYSSNHYPWRLLTRKGYEVRQVPFRGGGLDPEDVAERIDGGTALVAFSGVQSGTGHRSDVETIAGHAREVGALVFVDGSQMVGAVPVEAALPWVDVLVAPDHKFLLHAGRGMGYCYLSPAVQERFVPVNAGWKAARVPSESFYGPGMELSETASRFDESISWVAAVANDAALSVFETFGADAIHARNRELTGLLRASLEDLGRLAPASGRPAGSTIVTVPLGDDAEATIAALREHGVICAARDGNLRISVHFYNHEDDVERLVGALRATGG
jgi:cysteine desulfurase / selenocysteine lyase